MPIPGGVDNNVYFVDDAGDAVFENTNEGVDAVFATVDYTLTANVETLVLQGPATSPAPAAHWTTNSSAIPTKTRSTAVPGRIGSRAATAIHLRGFAPGKPTATSLWISLGGGRFAAVRRLRSGCKLRQNDATHWQINYNGGAVAKGDYLVRRGATIDASDFLFS